MSRPANPLRGECDMVIGGVSHVLRPSFENLILAEAEVGSLFALVERASEGALTLAEIAALVWHCLPAEGRPERAAVGEAVLAMGLVARHPSGADDPRAGAPGPRMTDAFAPAARRWCSLSARLLGWLPDTFWTATPVELATALADPDASGEPSFPTRETIARLMERDADG